MPMSSSPPRDTLRGEGSGDELELGVVGRPHGVRGAVHLRLHNPASDAFETLETLLIESNLEGRERFTIGSVEARPKSVVVTFLGVTSRQQAETLTGRRVFARRSDLPALGDDEYYLMDLVGCAVRVEGREIGRVQAVRGDPTVDTMIILLADGSLVEQPILGVFVKEVSIEQGRVELASAEGFIS